MGYHELFDNPLPTGADHRKAIAIAGAPNDSEVVGHFIDSLGFDPLYIGELSKGGQLEPGTAAFGANVSVERLKELV